MPAVVETLNPNLPTLQVRPLHAEQREADRAGQRHHRARAAVDARRHGGRAQDPALPLPRLAGPRRACSDRAAAQAVPAAEDHQDRRRPHRPLQRRWGSMTDPTHYNLNPKHWTLSPKSDMQPFWRRHWPDRHLLRHRHHPAAAAAPGRQARPARSRKSRGRAARGLPAAQAARGHGADTGPVPVLPPGA